MVLRYLTPLSGIAGTDHRRKDCDTKIAFTKFQDLQLRGLKSTTAIIRFSSASRGLNAAIKSANVARKEENSHWRRDDVVLEGICSIEKKRDDHWVRFNARPAQQLSTTAMRLA